MKDAYYFSHDGNARNDPKMLLLRAKFKNNGYACFFMILEMMRESHDYKLPNNDFLYSSVAIGLNETEDYIKDVFCHCFAIGLLQKDNEWVWSDSFFRRMERKENLSKVRSAAGRIGGVRSGETRGNEAKPKQTPKQNEAVKESKGKESKGKEHTTTASATADGSKPVNWDNCRNDLQRLIAHYIRSEMPELYKTGTQAQATALFKRYGRPASELLGVSGDLPTAKRAFDLAMAYFRKKGLSWNLSTVTSNSAEFVNAALQEKSKV